MAKLKESMMPLKKSYRSSAANGLVSNNSPGLVKETSSVHVSGLPRATPPSSQNLHSQASPSESQQEKDIKCLLKSYKRLEMALGKFNSKQAGITKTNILRTLVLPFLRSSPPLHSIFAPSSKIYHSFVSISTSILGRWWSSLLACLNPTGSSQVSASDRSAYLECISRIVARHEWLDTDPQARNTYKTQLAETLDYSITRLLSLKVVPVSVYAFAGKIFAYSFFHLPGVCNALLFFLNVKQSTLEKQSATLPPVSQDAIMEARRVFPSYLSHMIDYRGLVKLERYKKATINCVIPPKHPVQGIKEPSGPWVRRWCSADSDLFNSFLRHYVNIADSYVCDSCLIVPEALPGISVIASYIFHIFSVSITRISIIKATTSSSPGGSKEAPSITAPTTRPKAKENASVPNPVPSNFPYTHVDNNYTSITKLFRCIRDISYSTVPFAGQITKIVDQLLMNVAGSIGLYDVTKTSLLLNLVYEYSIHIFDTSTMNWEFWLGCCFLMLTRTSHVQIVTRTFAFLFNVWNKIPSYLTKFDEPRSISYLEGWLLDTKESYKGNFSDWLTSSSVWSVYFTHWNPLVRSHYYRLLIWRIIGVNNYESSVSIQTTSRVKRKLDFVHESLCKMLSSPDLSDTLSNLDFSSDSPIVNRKFGIVTINSKYSHVDEAVSFMSVSTPVRSSDLRKTHPYEIFDEAVYTCTSLPSSPASLKQSSSSSAIPKMTESNSLINSLGRLFKILSTDNTPQNNQFTMVPPKKLGDGEAGFLKKDRMTSRSLTSLSTTPSTNSQSTSPTLGSFQSSPSSFVDHSTDSSITSESDASSLLSECLGSSTSSTYSAGSMTNSQPPELFKVPPEIVRPIFKLDIVLDHELASTKYMKMQSSKSPRNGSVFFGSRKSLNLSYSTLPRSTRIPSVSIFLNSDIYSKFYITREEYVFEDEVLSMTDIKDLKSFSKDFIEKLSRPTDILALGKALNEWNDTVDEFESYLFEKVEADQANYFPMATHSGESDTQTIKEINEVDYFTRIIPLLPIDNFTESKLLNAS